MNMQKLTQKSLEALQDVRAGSPDRSEHGNQQIEQQHILYALLAQQDGLIPGLDDKDGRRPRLCFLNAASASIGRLPKVSVSGDEADKLLHLFRCRRRAEYSRKKGC